MTSRRCCCETFPACIKVTFSGIIDGTCDYCTELNRTFKVPKFSPTVWKCTLSYTCYSCTSKTITVTKSGTNWTVQVAGLTWVGTGDPTTTLTLTYDSSDDSCDGTGSTCTLLYFDTTEEDCICQNPCGGIVDAEEYAIAAEVEVVIEGLSNDHCSDCDSYNGTWVLPYIGCNVPITGTIADGVVWALTNLNYCSGSIGRLEFGIGKSYGQPLQAVLSLTTTCGYLRCGAFLRDADVGILCTDFTLLNFSFDLAFWASSTWSGLTKYCGATGSAHAEAVP